MSITMTESDGRKIALIRSDLPLIWDVQSALDLMMEVQDVERCERMAVEKNALAEDFFDLSTRIAGEILQKFITYGMKIAIVGDLSGYRSESLRAFVKESNRGRDIFFVDTEEEAIAKLSAAPDKIGSL